MITKEQVAELRRLLDEATPSDWRGSNREIYRSDPEDPEGWSLTRYIAEAHQPADAALIVALRNNAEALLAMVDDYELGISWDTTCIGCARQIETSYNEYARGEAERDDLARIAGVHKAEADRLRAALGAVIKITREDDDSYTAMMDALENIENSLVAALNNGEDRS